MPGKKKPKDKKPEGSQIIEVEDQEDHQEENLDQDAGEELDLADKCNRSMKNFRKTMPTRPSLRGLPINEQIALNQTFIDDVGKAEVKWAKDNQPSKGRTKAVSMCRAWKAKAIKLQR